MGVRAWGSKEGSGPGNHLGAIGMWMALGRMAKCRNVRQRIRGSRTEGLLPEAEAEEEELPGLTLRI